MTDPDLLPDSSELVITPAAEGGCLDRALDSMEAAAFVFDPVENRMRQFNDAAMALTGYNGYQLAHTRPSELFAPPFMHVVSFTQACLANGRAWSSDLALRKADSAPCRVEISASSFRYRDRDLILMICSDLREISARRAELEISRTYRLGDNQAGQDANFFRPQENGNQLLLHAAGEGIYGVDAKGLTTFLNPAAERILGWRAEELIGRDAHSLIHHSHEDGAPYPIKACPIYAAFRDGLVHKVDDEVFWRKDGTPFPVEYTSTPIQEKGRLLGAVVVFRDVSDQREAQRKLLTALDEVETLRKRLERENAYLQDELRLDVDHMDIVGTSEAIRNVLKQIELVGPSAASVLITGESGTGKELIARAIHQASPRHDRPLIRVNCASIPRELFESEFFGHARGAFTGAIAERIGRFELADGGTIFLDEIGELPLEHQPKLLRILQEQQFERVGETKTRDIDVRVIAATNRDIGMEVQEKRFREDLFFRLNVFPIALPPLRQRVEDIPLLATLFLKRAAKRMGKTGLQLSVADVDRFQNYNWPGNIRELENIIERAVITAVDGRLRFHVPQVVELAAFDERRPEADASANGVNGRGGHGGHGAPGPGAGVLTEEDRKAGEARNIVNALRSTGGKVSGENGAAALLGVKPTTLYSRIKKQGIDIRTFK